MAIRLPLIAGNWKMFGLGNDLGDLARLPAMVGASGVELLICPPATLIARAKWMLRESSLEFGGQDCHQAKEGAHTGDVSAQMLVDAGAKWVILGHSERRRDHGETDALIQAKLAAATAAGLKSIVCVGETIEERKAGKAETIVGAQLLGSLSERAPEGLVIAYEPVWAIGTGLTPKNEEIASIHAFIRGELTRRYGAGAEAIRVLYGGSVKPANAAEIFSQPGVDGALVGGASLKAADFSAIILAYPASAEKT
jgi:triosephosphate isomerase